MFLPVDREAYEAVSAQVMAALRESGAVVEVLGWDEAFLGIDSDDPEGFAQMIQQRVRDATQLDSTVGIGQNKLQAKLATGFGKPAGVFRLTDENWYEVLGGRPTDALWGIGAKTARALSELGIHTVRELAAADPDALARRFGPATGPWLVLIAQGHGAREVDDTPYQARSHGREVTFQEDIADWSRVRAEITRLAEVVAGELASRGAPGHEGGGQGALRAVHHPDARPGARRADHRRGGDHAGRPGRPGPVHRPPPGPPARRPRRVRPLIGGRLRPAPSSPPDRGRLRPRAHSAPRDREIQKQSRRYLQTHL